MYFSAVPREGVVNELHECRLVKESSPHSQCHATDHVILNETGQWGAVFWYEILLVAACYV